MRLKEKIKKKILLKLLSLLKPGNETNKILIRELFSWLPSSEKDWITRISIDHIEAVNSCKEAWAIYLEAARISIDHIEDADFLKGALAIYLREIAGLIEPEERFLLPSFEKGFGPDSDRFSYQKRYMDFNIKEGEKVLDIGSGAGPFPLATHLADLYEGETTHRVEPLVRDHRELRVCNIEELPYGNKEFEFVYCSHVLEHVSDPAKACEEIMRVGKRGYIETPTRTSDIMFNFTRLPRHHQWHINLLGYTLIFMEYAERECRDTGIYDFFKMVHSNYKNPFQTLMTQHRDLFVNMLQWEGGFNYRVFDKTGRLLASNRETPGQEL